MLHGDSSGRILVILKDLSSEKTAVVTRVDLTMRWGTSMYRARDLFNVAF
jgi:hypothetical protein